MDNRDPQSKQWTELLERIRDIRVAMLTTENENGNFHSRPMAMLEASETGVLWFFTGKSTHKAQEIEANPRVNLSFVAGDRDTFVSVSGEGRLVDEPEKAKALWNPLQKAWFPRGLEDPELGLLRVELHEAEYWDASSGKMLLLIRFAKAMAGMESLPETTGHGTLRFGGS